MQKIILLPKIIHFRKINSKKLKKAVTSTNLYKQQLSINSTFNYAQVTPIIRKPIHATTPAVSAYGSCVFT